MIFVGEELTVFRFAREQHETNFENHCPKLFAQSLQKINKSNFDAFFVDYLYCRLCSRTISILMILVVLFFVQVKLRAGALRT